MFRIAVSFAVLLFAGAIVVGCGDDDDDNIFDDVTEESEDSPTEAESPTDGEEATETATEGTEEATPASDGEFGPDDCPIEDEPFCEVAVQVANALVAGDAETIGELSLEQEINCEDVGVEQFPECSDVATLTGYITSAAQGENVVRSLDDYVSFVGSLLDAIDESASDATGSGEMRVLVVGPRGDGYDLLATAILNIEDPDFGDAAGEHRWFFFLSFDQTEELDWLIRSFVADTAEGFADAGFLNPATDVLPAPEPWGSGE
ncbi:MAG TPA: hypothetical protein VFO84_07945 [Dehalococcoidia bacterium]|nr:hypothetical protein [Dehalococcoidia bacterium]